MIIYGGKHMIKHFQTGMKRIGIRMKLILLILSISIIPMIVLILIQTNQYYNALTQQVQEKQEMLALTTATNMNKWLSLKLISIEESVKQQKDLYLSGDVERILSVLNQIKITDPESISISYLNSKGIGYSIDGSITDTIEAPGLGNMAKAFSMLKEPTV